MFKGNKILFHASSFSTGAWAPQLKSALDSAQPFLADWRPRSRIWRGTWEQWVQYEPAGPSSPFFWSGKPAIIASGPKAATSEHAGGEEALFVGFYIERGHHVRPDMPSAQMDEQWHWHGFHRCLSEPRFRNELNAHLVGLPEARRSIWIDCPETPDGNDGRYPPVAHVIPYGGVETLVEAKSLVDAIPLAQWINIIIGARFTKQECLEDQAKLLESFRTPIVRAYDVKCLVESVRP